MTPDIEKLTAKLRGRSLVTSSPFDVLRQFPRLPLEQSEVTAILAAADEAADALASLVRERDEARKKAGKLHDYSNMRDAQIVDLQAALTEISSPTQSLNLLWWQIRAREALAALSSERREGP